MKISTFINILLVVGVLLFVIVGMVKESETSYDINVNKTNWEGQYNFSENVNESIYPIQKSINTITNEDAGWLEKVGSGFTGIIAAVKFLPSLVWDMAVMGTTLITGIGLALGVPAYMMYVAIIMLTVWGIIELVQFYQRWNL